MAQGRTLYNDPATGGLTKRQRMELFRSSLWEVKVQNEAHWRDLADFIKPRRPRFFSGDRNKGDRRNQKIIDSTASFSARTLQSGMHAGMTNPARPWMKLLTPDPELNEFGAVKNWLHIVTQRMLGVFAQTNVYNALPVHYGDIGVFGTAATGILEDDADLLRSYNYPIGSFAIATNPRGVVDQWVYECQKSVVEIVEMYLLDRQTNTIDWTNASETLKNLWFRGQHNTLVDVTWIVKPNHQFDPSRLSSKYTMPYYSCHIEKGQEKENTFLKESGFEEFPIMASRWDVTGDDWWGTDCPGMVCLGDIKQLQNGEKRSAQAIEKMVNPPLKGPSAIKNTKVSLLPGDVTYIDATQGQQGLEPIHETNLAIDKLEIKQEACRTRIRRAFYEDLFLMMAYTDPQRGVQPPTATEVAERHEEKLIALGPVLERNNDELLDPMVDRTFAMMERRGLIPPAPPEMQGMKLKVEYTSIMAQAQKLVGVVAHERFLQTATALIEAFPQVRHKVNIFQAIDDSADMLGVNPKLVVPDDQAQQAAQQEQQMIQQQAAAQAGKDVTTSVKNLAQSEMTPDSALTRLMEGISGAVPA